jgi:hypothetical protein
MSRIIIQPDYSITHAHKGSVVVRQLDQLIIVLPDEILPLCKLLAAGVAGGVSDIRVLMSYEPCDYPLSLQQDSGVFTVYATDILNFSVDAAIQLSKDLALYAP